MVIPDNFSTKFYTDFFKKLKVKVW